MITLLLSYIITTIVGNTTDILILIIEMENNDGLEQDELEHLRKIFNKFDIGGDGNITFEVQLSSTRYYPKPCDS